MTIWGPFLGKAGPLSPAELAQRQAAGKASGEARHKAETTPSVRQGSSGAPSKQAVALFRQGQQRPDTRARRGAWDTRTLEAPIGAMNAEFRLHFPKAYRGQPDQPALRGKSMAQALARVKADGPHQDAVVVNPKTLLEAHRHPAMRQILESTVTTVRDHQKPTIERAMERGLIPPGAHPALIARGYKHAALKAIHKLGLGDYKTTMSAAAKAELKPLHHFLYYAHRRVFDHLNQGNLKGKWGPFREEFGELFESKKDGKLTGAKRMRMRPADDFYKRAPLTESYGRVINREQGTARPGMARQGAARQGLAGQGAAGQGERPTIKGAPNPVDSTDTSIALARRAIALAVAGRPVPLPPGGLPPTGLHTKLRHAAQHAEIHLGNRFMAVPRIGGSTVRLESGLYRVIPVGELRKDFSFTFGSNHDIAPSRQLALAMRPRVRRRLPKLRLNTQRHLRRLLNGGVTRTERWQLGAGQANFGKRAKKFDPEDHERDENGRFTRTSGHKATLAVPAGIAAGVGVHMGIVEGVTHAGSTFGRVRRGGKFGALVGGLTLLGLLPASVLIHDTTALARKRPSESILSNNWKELVSENLIGGGFSLAGAVAGGMVLKPSLQMQARAVPVVARWALGRILPATARKLRLETLRAVRAKAKAAPGKLVYRGAPATSDFNPQRRKYNAIYVAQRKKVTQGYGTGMQNPGSVTTYRIDPDVKLLNTDVLLPEHQNKRTMQYENVTRRAKVPTEEHAPLFDKLVPPIPRSPELSLTDNVKLDMARVTDLRALHTAPTKEQVRLLTEAGFHGTVGPNRNIALHDSSVLTPLYAHSRYSGALHFASGKKLAKAFAEGRHKRAIDGRFAVGAGLGLGITGLATGAALLAAKHNPTLGIRNLEQLAIKHGLGNGKGPRAVSYFLHHPLHAIPHTFDLFRKPVTEGKIVTGKQLRRQFLRDSMIGRERHLVTDGSGRLLGQSVGEVGSGTAALSPALAHPNAKREYHNHPIDLPPSVPDAETHNNTNRIRQENGLDTVVSYIYGHGTDEHGRHITRISRYDHNLAPDNIYRRMKSGKNSTWSEWGDAADSGRSSFRTKAVAKLHKRLLIKGAPIPMQKGVLLAIAGAAAAGKAASAIGRGIARHKVRVAASNMYRQGKLVRDGLHPPGRRGLVYRSAKRKGVQEAIETRNTGLANVRRPKLAIAGAAAAGGLLGLHHRSGGYTLPPDYYTADQPNEEIR